MNRTELEVLRAEQLRIGTSAYLPKGKRLEEGNTVHQRKLELLPVFKATYRNTTVARIEFGNYVVGVDAGGEVTDIRTVSKFLADLNEGKPLSETFLGVNHLFSEMLGLPAGCAPVVRRWSIGEIAPSGLTLVLGGADLAKTPAVHLLGYDDSNPNGGLYRDLRYGEPMSGSCLSELDVAVQFAHALLHYDSIVLDSIKDLLAEARGGAMASGVARGALPIFSSMSTIGCDLGVAIYSPINPSVEDDKVMKAMTVAVKSNVCSLVVPDEGNLVFSCRVGEGLRRRNFKTAVHFPDDSLVMEFQTESTASRKSGFVRDVSMPTVTDFQFDSILHRNMQYLVK